MRRLRPMIGLAVATACMGCAEEFDPQSLLNDIEILAIIAEPLDVGLSETTTVTPRLHVPDDVDPPELTWTACPVSLGGRLGFQCIDPRCEIPIEPTFSPGEIALRCFRAIEDDFELPSGLEPGDAAGADAEPLPVQVRLKAGHREAVTNVNLHFALTPAVRNRHPVITDLKSALLTVLEGHPVPVEVVIDPDSIDTFSEEEAGRTVERNEEILVEWYSSTGRFKTARTDGPTHENEWEAIQLEDGVDSAEIWAVARDFRGGQAIAGPLTIRIERN